MKHGLLLYHKCLEFDEFLRLEKVRKKYEIWQKFSVSDTDIISAKTESSSRPRTTSSASDELQEESSSIVSNVGSMRSVLGASAGTHGVVDSAAEYHRVIKEYLLSCNHKEARITIMYGAGNKDCLIEINRAVQELYAEVPEFNLALLKLEVVTCRYSGDQVEVLHDPALGSTIYQAHEAKGKKSRGKKNPQNDLIGFCIKHDVPFCLKYPICYVNPGLFETSAGLVSTGEIAYFQNYSQVEKADMSDKYAMKVKEDFVDEEKEIIMASRKRPGTKIGVYNQAYYNLCTSDKKKSIMQRSGGNVLAS